MLTPSKVASRVWNTFDGLAADTLWSGTADLVMMINAYVSVQILQETLAKETIGNYFGLFGVIGVLGAFVYSGVGMAALQRVLGDRASPNQVLSSYWSWSVLLAGGAILVVLLAGGLRLKTLSILEIFLLALSELIVVAMISVIASVSQGAVGFPSAARLRLGVTLIRLTTTVSLFLAGQFTIRNLGLGFVVGFSLYAAWVVYRYLPKHGLYLRWERPTRIEVNGSLTFSSPMAAGKVQTDGDKYLLNSFGYETQAASYGLAYRGMQVANAPLMALESAAFQRFLPKGDGQKGLHMRRANRFTMLMFGAGVVVAGIMFLALPLLKFLLFRGDTTDAGDILPFLLPLIPVMALSGTPLNGLIGLGRAKERGYLFALSAAISVALYLPLIGRFDWKGALVATYLSEFVLIVFGWYALWHYQRVEDAEIDEAARKKVEEKEPEQVDR